MAQSYEVKSLLEFQLFWTSGLGFFRPKLTYSAISPLTDLHKMKTAFLLMSCCFLCCSHNLCHVWDYTHADPWCWPGPRNSWHSISICSTLVDIQSKMEIWLKRFTLDSKQHLVSKSLSGLNSLKIDDVNLKYWDCISKCNFKYFLALILFPHIIGEEIMSLFGPVAFPNRYFQILCKLLTLFTSLNNICRAALCQIKDFDF